MADPTFIITRRDGLSLKAVTGAGGLSFRWSSVRDDATLMPLHSVNTLIKVLCPVIAESEGWKVEGYPLVCTGVAATWCPVCGDCACRPTCPDCHRRLIKDDGIGAWSCLDCDLDFQEHDLGERESDRNDPDCPLHRKNSQHAAGQ